jgi:hypothetical protein
MLGTNCFLLDPLNGRCEDEGIEEPPRPNETPVVMVGPSRPFSLPELLRLILVH